MLIIIMLVINGCTLHNKKAEKYVTFSYSDSVTSDYKCKIKDSKINCIVIEPENNELVFMGWYDEYDNKVDIEGDFQDSVVLHPKFLNEEDTKKEKLSAPKYTITFSMNGGSGNLDKIEIEYEGQLPKLNSVPTREGYIFVGFFDKPDYTKSKRYYDEKGESIRNFDKVNNTTMYAGWEKKKSEPSSSSAKPSSSTVKPSSSSARPSTATQKPSTSTMSPSTATVRPSTSSVKPSTSTMPPTRYKIAFDLNGGNGTAPGTINVTYGQTLSKLTTAAPTKTGHTFQGWYDNVDWSIGKLYYNPDGSSARPYDKTTNTTLYAGWKNKGVSINVATYNIGYFGCGTSSKVHCKATLAQITEMFNKYKIEMAGIQEAVPAHDVVKLGKNVGMNYYFKTVPANVNMILSKYEIKSKKATTLVSCHEKRSLDKVIVNINGVDISFYNTHYSYQSGCPAKQMEFVANIIKDDPNPVILTGDTNVTSIKYYETYLKPIGFEIAAYDGITHGYCDSVFIIPKGHIDVISAKTEEVYGIYSDHNFVVATLSIH